MITDRHLYLSGIDCPGMLWITDYALAQGWKISASSPQKSDTTLRLQRSGVNIHYGTGPETFPYGITEAIFSGEVPKPKLKTIPYVRWLEWIGTLTRKSITIGVAGSRGKSATTAMLGWILSEAGLDPTVFGGTTRIGKSNYLILEADENGNAFHHFRCEMVIILNIDSAIPKNEHNFRRFMRNLPKDKGIVVGYGRDSQVRKVCKGFSYRFRWYDETRLWPGLTLQVPSMPNQLNATAAARIAHELGVDSSTIQKALSSFSLPNAEAWNM